MPPPALSISRCSREKWHRLDARRIISALAIPLAFLVGEYLVMLYRAFQVVLGSSRLGLADENL